MEKKKQTPPRNFRKPSFSQNWENRVLLSTGSSGNTTSERFARLYWTIKWVCASPGRSQMISSIHKPSGRIQRFKMDCFRGICIFQHWQFIKHQFLCKLPGDNQTKILKSCRKKQKPSRITFLPKNNSFWASRFRESGSEKLNFLLF